jgi:peroxiredoxin
MDISMNKPRKHVTELIICAILFVALSCLWMWRRSVAVRQAQIVGPAGHTVMDFRALSQVAFVNADSGETVRILPAKAGPKRLLVFLSAADCSSCLVELGDWLTLAKSYPDDKFQVNLIFVFTDRTELDSFRHEYSLPYHIFLDSHNEVATLVGVPTQTPVSVLLDSNFHVLAAQGAEQADTARQAFVSHVDSLIQN